MSNEQPPINNPAPVSPTPQPPPAPKKRRKWPFIVVGLLLLLVLLVLLAPTIASTGPVRGMVVGQINKSLNGMVQINDWSFSWIGGTRIDGIRVFQDGAQIAEVKQLTTDLSVKDLLAAKTIDLGKVKADGVSFVLKIYEDGTTNIHKLLNLQPSTEPVTAPDLRGELMADLRGTIERAGQPPIFLDPSTVNIKISDINQPIDHIIALALRVGDGSQGKIAINGSAKVFEKKGVTNELDLSTLKANETIELSAVDVAGVGTLVGQKVQGVANGKLAAKVAGLNDLAVAGNLAVDNLQVPLGQDTFRTSKLTVTIPQTLVDQATGRIRIGQSGGEQVAVQFDQGSLVLAVDATQQALLNLAANKAPGADGKIIATTDLDLAKLAAQLPNLLRVQEGMNITGGKLHQNSEITLAADKAILKQDLNLTDLAAVNPNGLKVVAQPIQMTFSGSSLGGGGAIPDIRDFVLALKSGFATVNGSGESLAKLNIQGNADLAKARQELGQFVDFGKLSAAGQIAFNVNTTGDLTKVGGTADLLAAVTATNLKVEGLLAQPINEPWLEATAGGKLVRGQQQYIDAVQGGIVTLLTGSKQNPTVDLQAGADVTMQPAKLAVPRFQIVKANIDVPAAQKEFAAFLTPLQQMNLTLPTGQVAVKGAGSFDGTKATFSTLQVALNDLGIARQGKPVLQRYSGTLDTALSVVLGEKSTDAAISKLAWNDSTQMLSLQKVGDKDIVVNLPVNGQPMLVGSVQVGADLKALNDVLMAASDQSTQASIRSSVGDLRSGKLSGVLDLVRAQKPETQIGGNFTISDLALAKAGQTIQEKAITIALRAAAANDFSTVSAQQVDVKSSLGNVAVSDAAVRLSGANGAPISPLDMVQKAKVTFDVPNLEPLMALAGVSSQPGQQPVRQAAPAAAPARQYDYRRPAGGEVIGQRAVEPAAAETPQAEGLAPLEVRSGATKGTLRIERTDKGLAVNVDELTAQKIAVSRGDGRFGPKDVSVKLAALVVPEGPTTRPTTRPIGEQIRELQVTQLAGDIGVGALSLEEPIVIRNPMGAMQASGAVKVSGDIKQASYLLAVLQGKAFEYAGAYTLVERLKTEGNTVVAAGQLDVADFVAGNPRRPTFTEKSLRLTHDVGLDQKAQTLAIKSLVLDMQSSKALGLNLSGAIKDYLKDRQFENMKLSLSYDAAKVLDIVKPMLTAEQQEQLKDLKVAGVVKDRQFAISGKYPAVADPEKDNPLRYVKVNGSVLLDSLEYRGLAGMPIEKLELPITLADGKLTLADLSKPEKEQFAAPAKFSGGTLDLNGFQVDLVSKDLRVSSLRKDYPLMQKVAVNKEFVKEYLGKVNFFFTMAEDASGTIDVQLKELTNLPLGEALMQPARTPKEGGIGRLTFTLDNLRIKTLFGLQKQLANELNMKTNPDGSLSAAVKEAVVIIENGEVRSDMGFDMGGQVLGFRDASVSLSDLRINSMTMTVPKTMIKSSDVQRLKFLKDQISVPVKGTLMKPQFDILGSLLKSTPAQDLVPGALEMLKGQPKEGDQSGGGSEKSGGNLLDQLLGGQREEQQAAPKQQTPAKEAAPKEPAPKEPAPRTREPAKKPTVAPSEPAPRQGAEEPAPRRPRRKPATQPAR